MAYIYVGIALVLVFVAGLGVEHYFGLFGKFIGREKVLASKVKDTLEYKKSAANAAASEIKKIF